MILVFSHDQVKYCNVGIQYQKHKSNGFFSSFNYTFLFINILINIFLFLDLQQDIPQFFILLNERKNNINIAIDGKPILHFLVSKSEEPDIGTNLIKAIIHLGADVNAEDNSGSSALSVLASNYIGKQKVQGFFFYCFTVFNSLWRNKQ